MPTYCIPNLQFNDLIVYLDAEGAEFDTNGYLMLLFKLIVHHSFHKTRFAHTCITNDDEFEQMILSGESLVPNDLKIHFH